MPSVEDFEVDFARHHDKDIWNIYSACLRELAKRGLVRTRNIVGDRAEFLAMEFYAEVKGLPRLQLAPKSTKNVDALSTGGERYSIKGVTLPNKTTSAFYGLSRDEGPGTIQPAFEHVILVVMDRDLKLARIIELDWKAFLKHRKWHSRVRAWNLSLTKALEKDSKVSFTSD
jgi:hypothetical protein